jgi:hypothetical protein
MAAPPILVQGRGFAASCCRQLLVRQGAVVQTSADVVERKPAPRPALLLSPGTQTLLADIFDTDGQELFQGLPQIRRRIVLWGPGEPVVLPHSGVVVPERALLERFRERGGSDRAAGDPSWTVFAGRRTDPPPGEMHFGSRMALISEVEMARGADAQACWVESVEAGWLFLLPTEDRLGSLICVGGPMERLVEKSRLVARQVRKVHAATGEFAAYPRIASSLCGPGWFACGGAAMSFDPLCGEGAGNAAREAIMACAAVQAIDAGEAAEAVFAEYSLRLLLGFARHLENCREFYVRDRAADDFWNSELHSIEEGLAWTREQLQAGPRPSFRLNGFRLERIAPAPG